jgi:hypothetical protein
VTHPEAARSTSWEEDHPFNLKLPDLTVKLADTDLFIKRESIALADQDTIHCQ